MWTIAIVDDERQVLDGMRNIIPWQDLNAAHAGDAENGLEGLKLVLETQPDIVITDIYMPVKNGLEMIEDLRKEHYDGKIIILSGYSDFECARQAMRLSVDDYLSKPVTVQTLREVLGKTIQELENERTKSLEEDEWKRKLLLYEPHIKQERLKSLVFGVGNMSGEEWKSTVESRGETLSRVAAVEIIRNEREERIKTSDWNLFRFALGNIAQELAEELGIDATMFELYSRQMAILFRFEDACSDDNSKLLSVIYSRRLIQAAQDYLRIGIQVGIGGMKKFLKDISGSTEEAFQALQDKLCVPDEAYPIFAYKSKQDNQIRKLTELRPIQHYHEIASALRHFQQEEAKEAVVRLTERLKEWPGVTAAELQRVALEVRTICQYTLHEAEISLGEAFPPGDADKELADIVTPVLFRDWALTMISAVSARFGRNESYKHKQAVDFMVRYIHDHYAEELRLSDLAEKVYISRNYLSNIFRSATGDTFNDYLTKVRVEKAKSMIVEGKLKIYEIAEKVGYKNVPYFTIMFKKHTGRSPTEFVK